MASSVMQEKARERDHRHTAQSGTASGLLKTLWMRNESLRKSRNRHNIKVSLILSVV